MKAMIFAALVALTVTTGFTCAKNQPEEPQAQQEQATPPPAPTEETVAPATEEAAPAVDEAAPATEEAAPSTEEVPAPEEAPAH